jgi:hypothetical protein
MARWRTALWVVVLVGCAGGEPADGDGASIEPVAASNGAGDDDEQPEATSSTARQRAYLAAWTQCVNRTGRRVEQAWQRYELTADMDDGSPLDKEKAPFVYRVSVELEACNGLGEPPPGVDAGLPGTAGEYVAATTAFAELTRELAQYYDDEGYEADDWAKGEATAPKFKAAYETWTGAHAQFQAALDGARGQAEQAWLAELEDAGEHGLRWRVARLMLWARTVASCVAREDTAWEACRGSADDFHEVQAEIETYCRRDPAESVGVFWLDVLRRKAERLEEVVQLAATEPAAKKKKRAKPRPVEDPPPVDPSKVAVEEAFRELEVAADRVRFDFP